MGVRVFGLLLATTLAFFWTLESGAETTNSIQQFVTPTTTDEAVTSKSSHRCPYLDPCKIGDNYMELFEKIRKGVNCPPQPQRCSMTKSSTAATVTQPTTTTEPSSNPFNVFWCPYLQSDFGNKAFLLEYAEMLRTMGCPINSTLAVTNGTSTSVEPAKANTTTTLPATPDGDHDGDTIVVKKSNLARAILEAMTGMFRKFHF